MQVVLETCGKQYLLKEGDEILIEKIEGNPGDELILDRILLYGDGDDIRVGTPVVEGVKVRAKLIAQEKGPKVVIFKYKRRKNYRRKIGHRQQYTRIRIEGIEIEKEK